MATKKMTPRERPRWLRPQQLEVYNRVKDHTRP